MDMQIVYMRLSLQLSLQLADALVVRCGNGRYQKFFFCENFPMGCFRFRSLCRPSLIVLLVLIPGW